MSVQAIPTIVNATATPKKQRLSRSCAKVQTNFVREAIQLAYFAPLRLKIILDCRLSFSIGAINKKTLAHLKQLLLLRLLNITFENTMATRASAKHTTPVLGERIRLSASLILQSGKQFYSATMLTDILSECCFVTTRDESPVIGFQRVLDKKRAQDIADYIDAEAGTIPGSIILSAQPEAQLKLIGGSKTIEFTLDPKSFLVIDGQHRVYGFSLADKALRVPVVIYSELTPTEEARLFIDINTKQRAVPTELLLDIKQLAQRDSDKENLLRQIFDFYAEEPNSSLLGLMSAASRQKSRISRVTFNQAFKPVLAVFSSPEPKQIYQVTNGYIGAFVDVLSEIDLQNEITVPTVFRAVMGTFPEVARISAAQYGKTFNKSRFASVIHPIADQLTESRFRKDSKTVRELIELFAKLIKKDFSI